MFEKIRRWLRERPPLMRPASLQVVTEDVRKLGIGAMGAGVLGLFAPSDKIALGDSSVSPLFHRWCCNCLNSVENFSAINEIGGFPAGIMLLPLTP